ncbi:hypothetical protein P3T76_011874 [Phytophthora citrophthora]|uniref:Uncharacterized protein n=1 Tax=Phytophthora citrophthora TaxID=4793 RepID=A0AAD9G8E7_9STRA|nr:hypothetical protein P3T76_011874 [Phytophthora citrophthora]
MMPDSTAPRSLDPTPSSPSDSAAAQQPAPAQGPRSGTDPSRQLLSVGEYHRGYHQRHAPGSTSHGSRGSNAPIPTGSLGPRPSPRTWREQLEAGKVDFDDAEDLPARPEAAASVATLGRQLSTPNPFPERSQSLRNAPPLPSRYEDELSEPGVITNDLDEAQGHQLAAGAPSRSHRPVARPLLATSRRDYLFERFAPAEVVRRAALQPLDTYTCGPPAVTTGEVVQRQSLRERFLTTQVTTPAVYRGRLRQ